MKKIISSLLIVCTLLSTLLAFTACSNPKKGAIDADFSAFVKLDMDKVKNPTLDFGAFLEKNDVKYNDAWDVPYVMDKQKDDLIWQYLHKVATVDWKNFPKSYILKRRDDIIESVNYFYAYYRSQGYNYSSVDEFASIYYGYGASYKNALDYAEMTARYNLQDDAILYTLLKNLSLLPTEEQLQQNYDKKLKETVDASHSSNPDLQGKDFEEYYESVYGKGYLWESYRSQYWMEIAMDYFDKNWTLSLPEIDPASKPEFDKSPITPGNFVETKDRTDLVKITVSTADGSVKGDIYIRLFKDAAPKTVENFQNLVAKGFYDGLTFHRLVPKFCLQGGDPKADGTGGSGTEIKGEFYENKIPNHLSHVKGTVSMARGQKLDSASSQFFFVLDDEAKESLNGKYAAFGFVVSGMDVLDSLSQIKTEGETPSVKITLEKAVFMAPKN